MLEVKSVDSLITDLICHFGEEELFQEESIVRPGSASFGRAHPGGEEFLKTLRYGFSSNNWMKNYLPSSVVEKTRPHGAVLSQVTCNAPNFFSSMAFQKKRGISSMAFQKKWGIAHRGICVESS